MPRIALIIGDSICEIRAIRGPGLFFSRRSPYRKIGSVNSKSFSSDRCGLTLRFCKAP